MAMLSRGCVCGERLHGLCLVDLCLQCREGDSVEFRRRGVALCAVGEPRVRGSQTGAGDQAVTTQTIFAQPGCMRHHGWRANQGASARSTALHPGECICGERLIRDGGRVTRLDVALRAAAEMSVTDFRRDPVADPNAVAMAREAVGGRLLIDRMRHNGGALRHTRGWHSDRRGPLISSREFSRRGRTGRASETSASPVTDASRH